MLATVPPPTDQALLTTYSARGDGEAFAELARRHQGMVYGLCLAITRDRSEAEDCCQEVFLELARQARRIRGAVAAWLYTVAKRMALRRAGAPRAQALDHEPAVLHAPARELVEAVDAALARLDARTRTVLILRYVEDRSQEAIAAELGVHQTTVSRLLATGSERLKKYVHASGATSAVVVLGSLSCRELPAQVTAGVGKIAMAARPVAGALNGSSPLLAGSAFALVGFVAISALFPDRQRRD